MTCNQREVNLLAVYAGAELRRDAKERDDFIIGRALQSVEGLLHKIARHYRGTEDSLQEARIATLEAFKTYDISKGAFSTHVFQKARKAIQNERGITGSKVKKSYKQKGLEGSFSLHDKLADPASGESYQVASLDGQKVLKLAEMYGQRIKNPTHAIVWEATIKGYDVEDQDLALWCGCSRTAIVMAKQTEMDKFVRFFNRTA